MQIRPVDTSFRSATVPQPADARVAEFATLLVSQMIEPMLDTLPEGEGGFGLSMWRSHLSDALARQWVDSDALGLKDVLAREIGADA